MDDLKHIGKYELEEFLGGGMSRVYRARDTVIGRTVAIKILSENAALDPETKARFLREAQMAGNIAHPNIMSVYDFGEENGSPFMVMEFLRGENLRTAIEQKHTGDVAHRLDIALQIAKALEFIHQQKIVHRDVKPDNIHINADGTVKLVDFGIAKTENMNLTTTGMTLGTPYYMAPEQITGGDVTSMADVYSFGILLFELLTGTKAVTGDKIERLFYRILNERVDTTSLLHSGCPSGVISLIEKCIAKNPADRPQNMSIARYEIEQTLKLLKTSGFAESPAPRRNRWIIPAAIVALLAVVLAVFIFIGRRNTLDSASSKIELKLSPVLSTPTGEMVLIPAGTAPTFYLDRTEVTNEAYARFCAARQRPLPPGFPQDRPDLPVVNITIVDAQEFAKWAGKRLPNKFEWEKAARDSDGRAYPWGNTQDSSMANVSDNAKLGAHSLMPVTAFSEGASPYGVLQMAGNAWEFVDELITPSAGALKAFEKLMAPPPTSDEPWYTIRGGAFDVPLIKNAAFEWGAVPARFRAPDIGFRCARDAVD